MAVRCHCLTNFSCQGLLAVQRSMACPKLRWFCFQRQPEIKVWHPLRVLDRCSIGPARLEGWCKPLRSGSASCGLAPEIRHAWNVEPVSREFRGPESSRLLPRRAELVWLTCLGCISEAFRSRPEVMRDFSPFSVLVDLGDAPWVEDVTGHRWRSEASVYRYSSCRSRRRRSLPPCFHWARPSFVSAASLKLKHSDHVEGTVEQHLPEEMQCSRNALCLTRTVCLVLRCKKPDADWARGANRNFLVVSSVISGSAFSAVEKKDRQHSCNSMKVCRLNGRPSLRRFR